MKKIVTGKNKDALISHLKEIRDLTTVDSIVSSSNEVLIKCNQHRGRMTKWDLFVDDKRQERPLKSGLTYNSLKRAISETFSEMQLGDYDDFSIMVFVESSLAKRYDGKIKTSWLLLPLGCPYEWQNGVPIFQKKEIWLSKKELDFVLDSPICFWRDEILYPLAQSAHKSLRKFFDCSTAMMDQDTRLGLGIYLAEKLPYHPKLKLICKELSSNTRLVTSLIGRRFKEVDMVATYTSLLELLSEHWAYDIEKWEATSVNAALWVNFLPITTPVPYEMGIQLNVSEVMGESIHGSLYLKNKKGLIYVANYSLTHHEELTKELLSEKLIEPLFDAYKNFIKQYQICKELSLKQEDFDDVQKVIGKARMIDVEEKVYHMDDAISLLFLLSDTDIRDPKKSRIVLGSLLVDKMGGAY